MLEQSPVRTWWEDRPQGRHCSGERLPLGYILRPAPRSPAMPEGLGRGRCQALRRFLALFSACIAVPSCSLSPGSSPVCAVL